MKKKIKKLICVFVACVMFMGITVPAQAEEPVSETEWYELDIVENDTYFDDVTTNINARGVYISSVTTRIAQASSTQAYLRVDVICAGTMDTITSVLYLQKNVGGTWTTVGSKTVSAYDVASMSKTVSASGVTSGTYRCKSVTKVTSYSGATETVTGTSGAMTIS